MCNVKKYEGDGRSCTFGRHKASKKGMFLWHITSWCIWHGLFWVANSYLLLFLDCNINFKEQVKYISEKINEVNNYKFEITFTVVYYLLYLELFIFNQ